MKIVKKVIEISLVMLKIALIAFGTYVIVKFLCNNTHDIFKSIESIIEEILDVIEDVFQYAVVAGIAAVGVRHIDKLIYKIRSKKDEG